MSLYPPSQLDANQVLQFSFDDATQTLRTTAVSAVIPGTVDVSISHTNDSIKLGDGTTLVAVTLANELQTSDSTVQTLLSTLNSKFSNTGSSINANITNFPAIQPVSQSGTWNINNISGIISLPTGAATETTLNTIKTFLQNDYISGMIEAPQNKTYTLDPASIETRVLNSLKIYTSSGTCTVDIKINGASVTGLSSLSVTSTQQEAVATALNNVAIGDIITLDVTSSSGATDMVFRLKYTRS